MIKHYIPIFFFSFFLSFSFPGIAQLQTDLQEGEAQQSIWKISNPNLPFNGTAFSIGSNLFITNFHILLFTLKEGSIEDIALEQEKSFSDLTINQIVAISALHDLVLFSTKENVKDYLDINNKSLLPKEKIFTFGYSQGVLKKIHKVEQLIDNGYRYIFPANRLNLTGSSGSPILNTKKQVVGVVSSGSGNMLDVIKSKHLKQLAGGDIGLNCLDFMDLTMCIKKEIEKLKELAEQGHTLAQYELAKIYYWGMGTKKNLNLAFKWYKMSAEQGYPPWLPSISNQLVTDVSTGKRNRKKYGISF